MSIAANGKIFEVQLRAAAVKLARAAEEENGIDPQSGFKDSDIVKFIIDLPDDNEDQQAKAKAVLRRNGYNA